jgi:hypothetical protein
LEVSAGFLAEWQLTLELGSYVKSADNAVLSLRLLILPIFVSGFLFAAAATAAPPPVLQDQFGNSGSLEDFAGLPVLAIVASRRKLPWIGRWEATIRPELPQLNSIRIADITDEPRPSEAKVAEMLRKRAPEHVSILIDLQNEWASAYELDTTEPCLVLFDSEHKVVAKFRGRSKGELVNEVLAVLRTYFPAATES